MYKLTPRCRVPLKNLVVAQLLKKFLTIYETQSSLLCSQGPTTGHYPEPDEFTTPSYIFVIHFSIILPSTTMSYKTSLPFWFANQNFVHISDVSHACYMPTHLTLLDLILVYIMISKYLYLTLHKYFVGLISCRMPV
jgi:hypothetical protein